MVGLKFSIGKVSDQNSCSSRKLGAKGIMIRDLSKRPVISKVRNGPVKDPVVTTISKV